MFILHNIRYTHPGGDVLFGNINLNISQHDKVALIGNNGVGKSTLLRILAGKLLPLSGSVVSGSVPYYVPQVFGQFNELTIAAALGIGEKLDALNSILSGRVTEENMVTLNDDWGIEERCESALSHWGLAGLDLSQKMSALSGGQKTKMFLAGIHIHRPGIVLLDEPSNHLDTFGRDMLYEYIRNTTATLVVVSHDRALLNLLDTVYELSKEGVRTYGGNYDFYVEQKAIEANAFHETLRNKEKEVRKAKAIEREALERQQKLDARGKKKQEKAGLPTISMNTLRNMAERSTARLKDVHEEKLGGLSQELGEMRKSLPAKDKMKLGFSDSDLHKGKILIAAKGLNFAYHDVFIWRQPLDLDVLSGQRIAVKGLNGSGKSTLLKIILGGLEPTVGSIERSYVKAVYLDQDYSMVDDTLSVYKQAQRYNIDNLPEHELKSRLTHFLFLKDDWEKVCFVLSGGEKMRLMLCCLSLADTAPDIIILDEPTNNLDIQNVEILTDAINEYRGTLILVSHDAYFLGQVRVGQGIELKT